MAQLIQHKRGRLERLSTITGSLQKGEILIVTGSSNITASNGSSILFAATESGSVQATNRFLIGNTAPNTFPASTYGGLVNGVPYYDSGSGTLYLLGSDTNTAINLTGNISAFSSSVATSFSASNASIASVTGDFSSSVAQTFATQSLNLSNLSSSISQSIVDIVSASLSSSLSVIATDIEVAIVSASLSSSQALISSSISESVASGLSSSISSITTLSSSVSSSLASLSASSGFINYVTNSVQNLTGIEVADFDSNTAVTFTNGVLKFIFGTPTQPSSVAASTTGFATDRFNNVTDAYSVNGSWNNQGYTLVSASLYEGATLLTQVGSGTSLTYSTTTSGSHTYRLEYTASSPLDNSLYKTSTTTTGTVSKSNPAAPTLTPTTTVQLGSTSNQIEQGATGSISFTSSSANPSNSWNLTSVTTNVASPYYITGSATGSTSISITATANYASPTGDNVPDTTTTSTATTTYTKIRSLRYGASAATAFTAGELENIGAWDTTIGGTIGTIVKGTTTASGQSVTISWTGDKYHYIVFNSSLSNLSNITTSGFGVLGSFAVTTVGQYKVYKTTTLQAGGAGSSITYILT
jgi:trimeric autotransporter adhesin